MVGRLRLNANGQPVWFVAVRVRAARFLQVLVDGIKLSYYDKAV
jgi:hypothetical protein